MLLHDADVLGRGHLPVREHWMVGPAGLLVAMLLMLLPSPVLSETGLFNLHLEGEVALMLGEPQRTWFGPGGGGAFKVEVAPWWFLGFHGAFLFREMSVRSA